MAEHHIKHPADTGPRKVARSNLEEECSRIEFCLLSDGSPSSICSSFRRSTRNLSWCRSSGLPMPSTAAMSRSSSRLSKPDLPDTLVPTVPSDVSDIVSVALLSFCITSSGLILSEFSDSHSPPVPHESLWNIETGRRGYRLERATGARRSGFDASRPRVGVESREAVEGVRKDLVRTSVVYTAAGCSFSLPSARSLRLQFCQNRCVLLVGVRVRCELPQRTGAATRRDTDDRCRQRARKQKGGCRWAQRHCRFLGIRAGFRRSGPRGRPIGASLAPRRFTRRGFSYLLDAPRDRVCPLPSPSSAFSSSSRT